MKLIKTAVLASALVFCANLAHAGVISYTGMGGIVDDRTQTRSLTVNVTDIAGYIDAILDVNLTVDFSKCNVSASANGCVGNDGTSTFNNEIVFKLIHGGTSVDIVNQNTFDGQNGNVRVTQTYDDQAAASVGGSSLINGMFKPVSELSAFNGMSALGLWTFHFQDTYDLDPLVVHSWRLDISLANATAVVGAVLAGLVGSGSDMPWAGTS